MKKKLRVALLFGGKSAEHEISLISARNIVEAMDKTKYDVVAIGIDKQGRWHLDEGARLLHGVAQSEVDFKDAKNIAAVRPGDTATPVVRSKRLRVGRDRRRLSGAARTVRRRRHSSGFAQARQYSICRRRRVGLRCGHGQGRHETFVARCKNPDRKLRRVRARGTSGDPLREGKKNARAAALREAGKPGLLGRHLQSEQERINSPLRCAPAFRYDNKIIIEEAIRGREIECSVLGNEKPIASLPGEIVVQHDFYSYDAKYLDDQGARLEIPARLPKKVVKEIQRTALRAYRALCCEGMARVDFFLRPDGKVLVNEINTIPGFTKISMYPKMWEATGLSYSRLIDRLIGLALERARHEKRLRTSK